MAAPEFRSVGNLNRVPPVSVAVIEMSSWRCRICFHMLRSFVDLSKILLGQSSPRISYFLDELNILKCLIFLRS